MGFLERGINQMKRFWIYWNNGNDISCFRLKNRKQAESIAKCYPNVIKIERKR